MHPQATRGTARSKTRRISDRFIFNYTNDSSVIDIELFPSTQFIFSGDLSPEKPEYDELMADLTEDELKAAFRFTSHFLNSDVSTMILLDLYSVTVKVLHQKMRIKSRAMSSFVTGFLTLMARALFEWRHSGLVYHYHHPKYLD